MRPERLDQSTPELDVDVLIIDDCSSDETPAVGERLAAGDSRVEFRRHHKNRGHLATYDEGLAWVHGDYCVILSADDLLVPGALLRAAGVLDTHPTVGLAYGRSLRFTNDEDRPAARTGEARVRIGRGVTGSPNAAGPPPIASRPPKSSSAPRSSTASAATASTFRTRVIFEMWLRLAAHADVAFLGGVDQAYYRMHAASMARTRFTTASADLRQRKAAFDAVFDEHGRFVDDSARLRARAGRALAREALWSACHGMDRVQMDAATVAELEAFALAADPHARRLSGYRGLQWRRRIEHKLEPRVLTWLPPAYVTTAVHKAQDWRWWRRWNAHGV